jgi:hypothetical protein
MLLSTTACADGFHFRDGLSLGGGREMVSNYSFTMGGLDGRLGLQVNDELGFYLQPHLSFGSGSVGNGFTGSTGTFALTALADWTFLGRLFVAGGGGFGVLNNPSGPVLHFRAGGYPWMSVADDGVRHSALMIGLDSRTFFVDGATVEYIMVSLGWEKF